ncbi:glucose 1-dehydrogenase [Chlorogloeopsis fritschii PCC 9212]|uniref:glucose 1-dehydrogenase n=1 Tax=Chlorogloeopsis fritschii TaxID=1124 RepID=UPI00370DC62E
MRFQNKVVLVTGGNSGIGCASAIAFGREGAKVAIAARREQEGQEIVRLIQETGGEATFIQTDVSRSEEITRLISKTIEIYGRLDCAFNNAGTEGVFAPMLELKEEDWDRTIAVNLKAVWLCMKHEIEAFLKQGSGGVIVNTSSWLAVGALVGSTIYSASKAGIDGLMQSATLEFAQFGIRINNINPGIIDTPMLRRFGNDEAFLKPFIAHTPMQRLGTPQEVAETVLWLCSDAASFMNGQSILVDGGWTIPGIRNWLQELNENRG